MDALVQRILVLKRQDNAVSGLGVGDGGRW